MRKFSVTVNGVTYEVVVEEVAADAVVTTAAPAAPAAPTVKAAPKAEPKPAAAAGSTPIKSPFPGTVLKVNVAVGQSVKKEDVLMVVEAMKMENEIKAPADGVVASVNVNKGASVQTDDLLCSLK